MEQKKRFKTIFIALIMFGAMLGVGLGVAAAVRHSETAGSAGPCPFRGPHGPGKLQ